MVIVLIEFECMSDGTHCVATITTDKAPKTEEETLALLMEWQSYEEPRIIKSTISTTEFAVLCLEE